MDVTLLPVLPGWVIVAVAVGLLVLLAYGSIVLMRKRVPDKWIKYLAALRVLAVVLFILCLLRPALTFERTSERRPGMMVLVDTSRSMSVREGEQTRLQQAMSHLGESDLADSLGEQFDVQYFAFDRSSRLTDRDALAQAEPSGESTRLAESLTSAWTQFRQRDEASGQAQVLLISDAIDQSSRDAAQAARELGLTVNAMALPQSAQASGEPRVSIVSTQSPRRVLLGAESRFTTVLRQRGLVNVPLKVSLLEDDQVVAEQEVTFGADERERAVMLLRRPMSPGNKAYRIEVGAAGEDALLENPPAPVDLTVQVVGRVKNVLVLEDTYRWSFKYLRRVLEDDPTFAMTAFLSRGTGIYMQYAEPDRTAKLGGFPQSAAELEWFDVIVLGDVKPNRWPPSLAPAINRMVVEEGKSLVVLAGPNLSRWSSVPMLANLLPVELGDRAGDAVPGPLGARPSTGGLASPMFYSPGTGESPGVDWAALPPMDQLYVPLHKKPAATILLESPDFQNDFGNAIVMAEHTVGRGRVLYVGTDTLWKWQMLGLSDQEGLTPYDVFWQQALRAMAPQQLSEGTVRFALTPDRYTHRAGDSVRLSAEVFSGQGAPVTIEATVRTPDDQELPIGVLSDPQAPSRYRAVFEASQPGAYRVRATAMVDGKPAAELVTAIHVDPAPSELDQTDIDHENLARLAAATGGKVVDPGDQSTWPAARVEETTIVQKAGTLNLWSSFILPLLLVTVLGVDWLLRLLRGFV